MPLAAALGVRLVMDVVLVGVTLYGVDSETGMTLTLGNWSAVM